MKDWIVWILTVLIGLCFAQNILLSKKIAVVYWQNQQIKKLLYEGTCD